MTTLFRDTPSSSSDLASGDFRYQLFARLVGISLVAHVVGNWSQPDLPSSTGWANLAVGILGLVLSAKPSRIWLLIASGLTLLSLGLEIPFTGSHWMLAGLMAMATLVTLAYPGALFPTIRWILLLFYVVAAFAKLNTAFFDPTVSCSMFYANQSLQSLGLAPLPATSPVATAVVWGAALTEMSVPLLLMARRTRYWGVIVGMIFHGLISLDLGQHFYDFTAVLLPGFFLFLPDHSVEAISRFRSRVAPVTVQRIAKSWLLVGSILVVAAVSPLTVLTLSLLQAVPFVMWIPFLVTWIWCLLAARNSGQPLGWKLKPLAAAVVGMTLLNGLTPYFEVKTAFSFNMYSNLLTAGGESNHIIVSRTLPLRDGYRDPIEILESSDPALEMYRSSGYLLPYPSFRRYLASNRDLSVVFRRGDEIVEVDRASDRPELVDSGPWWWRFLPLRAIDQTRPTRCQSEFLPAL